MANNDPVIVFFGDLMMHINDDQAQRMLMLGQIVQCSDRRIEHYHLTQNAVIQSTRGQPVDLRPARTVSPAESQEVVDMIDRCIKGNGN